MEREGEEERREGEGREKGERGRGRESGEGEGDKNCGLRVCVGVFY